MDVLEQYKDYLANSVAVKTVIEELCDLHVFRTDDYTNILDIGKRNPTDMFQANRAMYQALQDCLSTYDDNCTCLYSVFDIIRNRYPGVAIHIPAIQQGLRFKEALGSDTLLTVCNVDGDIGYDIRKMKVSN